MWWVTNSVRMYRRALDALEHFIPLLVSKETLTDGSPIQHNKRFRSRDCSVLLNSDDHCNNCKQLEKKKKNINTPAKKNTPLSNALPKRVVLALKAERLEY